MLDENIISTLEQSLRQTRNTQRGLIEKLRQVESEAGRLREEIQVLENVAQQASAAINSILATMRTGSQIPGLEAPAEVLENYEIPKDILRQPNTNQYQTDEREYAKPPANTNREPQNLQPNYDYDENSRRTPPIGKDIEAVSSRFADRTITQACTLLLRESSQPLHVNELYNALVLGGFKFTGNNPTISIAVSLNRNNRFKKVAPGTFDLVMRAAS